MSPQADAEWARRIYRLRTVITGSTLHLAGTISFRAHYNGDLLIYHDKIPIIVRPETIIKDSWPIIFLHNYRGGSQVPRVFDASDRLYRTQDRLKVSSQDMHLNATPPGSFCVAPRSELEQTFANGFDLEKYFNQYLVPFLFQQSYFEKYGKWPWWNYPHGDFGEYLREIEEFLRA